jgi:hypothetical protein
VRAIKSNLLKLDINLLGKDENQIIIKLYLISLNRVGIRSKQEGGVGISTVSQQKSLSKLSRLKLIANYTAFKYCEIMARPWFCCTNTEKTMIGIANSLNMRWKNQNNIQESKLRPQIYLDIQRMIVLAVETSFLVILGPHNPYVRAVYTANKTSHPKDLIKISFQLSK